jgi:hypothetical protein
MQTFEALLSARLRPPLLCGSSETRTEIASSPRLAANAGDLGTTPRLAASNH